MPEPALPGDADVRDMVESIARICLCDNFVDLCNELEVYYSESGDDKAKHSAFKDAFYAMIQEGLDSWDVVKTSELSKLL